MTLATGCTAVEVGIPATGEQVGYSFVQEGFGMLALSSALRCRGRRVRLTYWRWIQTPVHGFAFGVW
jgi:hypothetical protein